MTKQTAYQQLIGKFIFRQELIDEVKVNIEIALERKVSNEEVSMFLVDHPTISGSIVGYDEVDTEDRYRIWEACRIYQPFLLQSGDESNSMNK